MSKKYPPGVLSRSTPKLAHSAMFTWSLELNFLTSKMRTEPTIVFLLSFVSISVQKFSLDISTRVEALEAAMSLMNEELNERDEKIAFLEESVKNISEGPYGVWCGYKAEWKDNDSIITFDDPWNPPDIDETNLPRLDLKS